jgi:hypothetical protein
MAQATLTLPRRNFVALAAAAAAAIPATAQPAPSMCVELRHAGHPSTDQARAAAHDQADAARR